MAEKKYSLSWKRSGQPRKQRKFGFKAPLHLQSKKAHVHLSPELRKKYGFRSLLVRREDKVKVLRGKFAKKEGKVERVDLKRERVYMAGVEVIKKDGTKKPFPLPPSNLMITELFLSDKKRKRKLESKELTVKNELKKGLKSGAGAK